MLLDGVFSHTGEDSVYFNHFGHYPNLGAYQGDSSPYYDWYTFKKFPDEYACWWGIPSLPECGSFSPAPPLQGPFPPGLLAWGGTPLLPPETAGDLAFLNLLFEDWRNPLWGTPREPCPPSDT